MAAPVRNTSERISSCSAHRQMLSYCWQWAWPADRNPEKLGLEISFTKKPFHFYPSSVSQIKDCSGIFRRRKSKLLKFPHLCESGVNCWKIAMEGDRGSSHMKQIPLQVKKPRSPSSVQTRFFLSPGLCFISRGRKIKIKELFCSHSKSYWLRRNGF